MQTRKTKPYNNKYYITTDKGGFSRNIKGKPTDAHANVLANCVGYANGRFAEIIGANKIEYQFIQNAETFVKYAKQYGLDVIMEPSLGGIMVFEGIDNEYVHRAGHVCIVEELRGYNHIYTSESAWNSTAFYNKVRKSDVNNWGLGVYYKFIGCIVNPKIGRVVYEDFKKGCNYKTTSEMYVRSGAGTKCPIKKVKDLTADGKKNATSKNPNALAVYKDGTIYTALDVITNNDGTWAKTPSGYVCMKGASGKVYCVKC